MAGPNDPNLDIKIKVTGASGGDAELRKVETRAKVLGQETDKTAGSLGKLSTGFQKLSGVAPGLAAAIRTLSSPYAALAAAVAIATRKIQDFIAEVEQQVEKQRVAELAAQIQKVSIASNQAQIDSNAFAKSIEAIAKAAPPAEAALARINEQIKLRFELEKNRPGGPAPDLEGRQRQAEVTAIFNARTRAREQKEAALAQEPAAAAEARRLADRAATFDGDIELLKEQAEAASKEEAAALDRAQGPHPQGDLDIFFRPKHTTEKQNAIAEQARARKESILELIQRRTDDQAQARGAADLAKQNLNDIRARGTAAAITERSLTDQLVGVREGAVIREQFNPGPPALGPGSLQFRHDAQRANLRNQNVREGWEGLGRLTAQEVAPFIKGFRDELKRLTNGD